VTIRGTCGMASVQGLVAGALSYTVGGMLPKLFEGAGNEA